MLAYRLDKQIPAEKIIQDIQRLISGRPEEKESLLLVISIKPITNTTTSLIPKIEYRDCST